MEKTHSNFIRFEQCPQCNKAGKDQHHDNLGIFDDGHKYCFACGYFEGGSKGYIPKLKKEIFNNEVQPLPQDFITFLPNEGVEWLKKYGISSEDIIRHQICWSSNGLTVRQGKVAPLLLFPIYDLYGRLAMWQGRNMGKVGPKYITMGDKETILHCLGTLEDPVVIVEDFVSAVRVSKKAATMPLFGSSISRERLIKLAQMHNELVVWLDPGAESQAKKIADQAYPMFAKVGVVMTKYDPKCLSNSDIGKELIDFLPKTPQNEPGDEDVTKTIPGT